MQVKKKMNPEDFIKNNRGINDGENLPEDFLRLLFDSISSNEIKISSDASAAFTPVDWEDIARQSTLPRAHLLNVNDLGQSLIFEFPLTCMNASSKAFLCFHHVGSQSASSSCETYIQLRDVTQSPGLQMFKPYFPNLYFIILLWI